MLDWQIVYLFFYKAKIVYPHASNRDRGEGKKKDTSVLVIVRHIAGGSWHSVRFIN